MEIILLAQFFLLLGGKRLEIAAPAGTEINLPTPETTDERLGILVVLSTKLAVLAGILHNEK